MGRKKTGRMQTRTFRVKVEFADRIRDISERTGIGQRSLLEMAIVAFLRSCNAVEEAKRDDLSESSREGTAPQ